MNKEISWYHKQRLNHDINKTIDGTGSYYIIRKAGLVEKMPVICGV